MQAWAALLPGWVSWMILVHLEMWCLHPTDCMARAAEGRSILIPFGKLFQTSWPAFGLNKWCSLGDRNFHALGSRGKKKGPAPLSHNTNSNEKGLNDFAYVCYFALDAGSTVENGLGELHCTLPVVDLSIPPWWATDQALRFVMFHRVTVASLNADISSQNYVSGWHDSEASSQERFLVVSNCSGKYHTCWFIPMVMQSQ